ncbi:putative Winged-helix DNA-binding transcription factor family protein [Hibiscus syriacus]|uniref:RING-type E3 ubiquitin transferase n=1 Tax=Hibiscus syriacus TaxID=106335 RepID=A0A6A3BID2_HIBSY|nr:E3 ubiquitin-protein ligase SDIR1-like [Hibiscus syriacus]KAE8714539.1 putative Winged-helix DNA-binding transcription factor family protein [Hibiscus syriacus]
MASGGPRFLMTADYSLTPTKAPRISQIEFLLHIRTFLEDDNGRFREDHSQDFSVWPEFVFGSRRHRNNVARRLLEAGWLDQRGLERILDQVFSESNSIIEKEKKSRNSKGFDNVIRIIFQVKKYVRRERYDELAAARAMELSMREAPKLVPATKESIKALKKVKLVEGYGDGIECMICMEKLVRSKTEVVTSMPCSHLFHGDCIERWLSTGHLCPLCRFPMPTDAVKH